MASGTVADERAAQDPAVRRAETVLVTGGDGPLGRAVAGAFRDADWRTFVTAETTEARDALEPADVEVIAPAAGEPDGNDPVVETVLARADSLECLVAVAPLGPFGTLEAIDPTVLGRGYEAGVLAVHRRLRAALGHMRTTGKGRVIAVLPTDARFPLPGRSGVAGPAGALDATWTALRGEARTVDIGTSVVAYWPDRTWTDRSVPVDGAFDGYPALERLVTDVSDLGGAPADVEPSDIAARCVHVASCPDPRPRYTVGRLARIAELARFVPERHRSWLLGLATRVVG